MKKAVGPVGFRALRLQAYGFVRLPRERTTTLLVRAQTLAAEARNSHQKAHKPRRTLFVNPAFSTNPTPYLW